MTFTVLRESCPEMDTFPPKCPHFYPKPPPFVRSEGLETLNELAQPV